MERLFLDGQDLAIDLESGSDAIYSLTQPLEINLYATNTAVVMPTDIMAPFNSHNTLFVKDALWGLLIPVTTTFKYVAKISSFLVIVKKYRRVFLLDITNRPLRRMILNSLYIVQKKSSCFQELGPQGQDTKGPFACRVCDIWRGFWAQRLLWEIGGNIAFGILSGNRVRHASLPYGTCQYMLQ